ncbi:hypothetical protein NM688_g6007 [Phlebia brevispora]|uniref:Uncharacterized protein n=1 Tax=Phlebia brevispora TaxID=194682 RepID=A0ACC1SL84_9APHY|nr:hypothetical protein NM688_g6007 [Phlebia brevispora]
MTTWKNHHAEADSRGLWLPGFPSLPLLLASELPCFNHLLLMARSKHTPKAPVPAEGDESAQGADVQLQGPTPGQKAAEVRARHRLEEEENQHKDAEHVLATGPRPSKTWAGDKIREWNAPSRKRTISQTGAEPELHRDQPQEKSNKLKKPRQTKTSNPPKSQRDTERAHHSRSLLNHEHDNEDSDDSPLATAARKPLTPKAVVKNAERSRKPEKNSEKNLRKERDALNNEEDGLRPEDWPSDNERGDRREHGSDQSGEDGDDDSFKPSEESDGGNVNKSIEVPKWVSKSSKNHPRSSVQLKTRANNDVDDEELAGLIPDIDDSMRSRRSSITSVASMHTASFAGPPPTMTTVSDDDDYRHCPRMTSDGDGSQSDASSELDSDCRYHEDEVGRYDAKQNSRRQQDMCTKSDKGKGKSHRQMAAEAEASSLIRPRFKEAPRGGENPYRESAPSRPHEDNYYNGGDGYRKDVRCSNAERYNKERQHEDDYQYAGRRREGNYDEGRRHEGNYDEGRRREGNYDEGRHCKGNYDEGRRREGNYDEGQCCEGNYDEGRRREDSYRDESRRPKDSYHDRGKHGRHEDHHTDRRHHEDHRDIHIDEESQYHTSRWQEDMRDTATSAYASSSHAEPQALSQRAARELKYPKRTHVVWTDRGKINIKDQTPLIQMILETYIKSCLRDFALNSGIPAADVQMQRQCQLLIEATDSYNTADIGDQIEEDRRYRAGLIAVVQVSSFILLKANGYVLYQGETRVGVIRGNLKKSANSLVASEYGLVSGEAGPRIAALLASSQWIYAGDVLKIPEFGKPFEREIFSQLLVAHFFNGPSALGSSLMGNFKSSLEGKPDEKEIPAVMLAVVAATVALSIADWSSGTFTAPKVYNTSLAEQYYCDVMAEFDVMKRRSMMAYHRIMHNLWNRVNRMTGGGASSAVQGTRGPSKMALEE